MLQAVSGEVAFQSRREGKSHSGDTRWQTYFIGKRHVVTTPDMPAVHIEVGAEPQCHVSEMGPQQSIATHFHQTDQFQVMAAGTCTVDGEPLPVIALHFGDHHTVFGNLTSGPEGLWLFTMCNQFDPGGIYLHQKGSEALLKPSKRRSLMAKGIRLSAEYTLKTRKAVALESLFEKGYDGSDGLGAYMLRLGAGMKTMGPDPKKTGGQFYLVVNGSLNHNGASYPTWSAIYADSSEAPFEACAGARGVEALIMNFPRANA